MKLSEARRIIASLAEARRIEDQRPDPAKLDTAVARDGLQGAAQTADWIIDVTTYPVDAMGVEGPEVMSKLQTAVLDDRGRLLAVYREHFGDARLDRRGRAKGRLATRQDMQHLLVHYLALLFSFNNKTIYGINVDLFKWLLFWVKYLDKWIAHFEMAYVLQNSTYFIGRKPKADMT